ncbi:hypothetical protein PT974_04967 [Cladobotryum mycophilum]|uniref:P-loop containing nucleoside triphosphate hydrolase n=1 Tax=Cladobotryum mycophilum TaxID=491253 RepID=A0ABR0SRZ0_9HYPO
MAALMSNKFVDLFDFILDLEQDEINTTPLFTQAVRDGTKQGNQNRLQKPSGALTQFGVLALNITKIDPVPTQILRAATEPDRRILYNVAAPSSMFICGSQGSGKSHTLSTILENCLLAHEGSVLPRPLTGLVFHYDTFISDKGGAPCEAAYLSSNPDIKVKVLCPPTNIRNLKVLLPLKSDGTLFPFAANSQKKIYSKLPNVTVEELLLNESDLNTRRMRDLMAVSSVQGGGMPLYLHTVERILRDLRREQQLTDQPFSYSAFKRAIAAETLTGGQLGPLQQRLDNLESFMVKAQAVPDMPIPSKNGKKKNKTNNASFGQEKGNDWTPAAGTLTIVDLSCPCVTAETACLLFNICLGIFLEQDTKIGRVIALDEAHKYMLDGVECRALTESLLSIIRQQRHLGARVIISTQEPTISPKLLDLCSVTIVHRFTSPVWLQSLRQHLAGSSALEAALAQGTKRNQNGITEAQRTKAKLSPCYSFSSADELFSKIVNLRTGEALVFAPNAVIGRTDQLTGSRLVRLGDSVMKVLVRRRVTADGGGSIMAA